jgi:RNA polymerase sigma-70 factor (ECF subfamily)
VDQAKTSPDALTRLVNEWRHGATGAGERLMQVAYPELNRIAERFLRTERASHTLDQHALVHELWIRMTSGLKVTIQDRSHFFALAANMMRRILIDHARARAAEKRGGDRRRVSLTAVDGFSPVSHDQDLISLESALADLEGADPRAAKVVELRFFAGLDGAEIADALGISEITVKRDWRAARAWLLTRLADYRPPRSL